MPLLDDTKYNSFKEVGISMLPVLVPDNLVVEVRIHSSDIICLPSQELLFKYRLTSYGFFRLATIGN